MIKDGSFDSESILFLYRNDTLETTRVRKRYFLKYKKAHQSIGYLSSLKFDNKSTDSLSTDLDVYHVEMNVELALRLKKLYKTALLKVSPDLKPISGNDGTYYFFHARGLNIRSGMTWSPGPGTKMRELAEINEQIIQMIIDSPEKITALNPQLADRMDALIMRIETEND